MNKLNKNRKGLIIEALLRLIIAVALLVVIFNIGKLVAGAMFGGSALQNSFGKFVEEVDNIDVSMKQAIIYLEPDTAIIGFSSGADAFRCIGCTSRNSEETTSYFKKPENEQCSGKNCICLCQKSLQIESSKYPLRIGCEKLLCNTLNSNLAAMVKIDANKESSGKWAGGFFFLRKDLGSYILNSEPNGLPQKGNKFTVFVRKENINGTAYAAVCPLAGCALANALPPFKDDGRGKTFTEKYTDSPLQIY